MKKIINGKKYDTDTAREMGHWDNGRLYSDFGYMEETLYLKKTGEYFLHGEGGPATKYADYLCENTTSYGEAIIPLDEDEAKSWAEQRLDCDNYERIFGEVEE